jgi:hypothetical protein
MRCEIGHHSFQHLRIERGGGGIIEVYSFHKAKVSLRGEWAMVSGAMVNGQYSIHPLTIYY